MQALASTGRYVACALKSSTSLYRCSWCLSSASRRTRPLARTYCSEALAPPDVEGEPKNYPPKIQKIVDEISQLTLLEVADLNELLKKTLNIADTPMMPMGMAMPGAQAEPQEEEAPVKQEQAFFTVNLVKFDESKKVALIKEIKTQIAGMNLVQSKKFVESVPQEVKGDLSKEEAEKLKSVLEAAGGTVEIQ